jgi:hypothetical protein
MQNPSVSPFSKGGNVAKFIFMLGVTHHGAALTGLSVLCNFSKIILLMIGIDHLGVCIPRLKNNMKGAEKDEDPEKERTEQTSKARRRKVLVVHEVCGVW